VSHGTSSELRRGIVVGFDDPAGYGTIAETEPDNDSGEEWFFHCSAIADGSRTIDPATAVICRVAAGRMGQFEAIDIRPV